jgi:hypothetical protein
VVGNINDAATGILREVESYRNTNVFYFDGWYGIGASAALKVAAHRMKSSGSKFDMVLHLDCSLWKSRRALQKAIIEEIKLPHSMMAILSQIDKEDDFNNVKEDARREIWEINKHTYRRLANVNRFVVVFLNGSEIYIDLNEFGIPLHRNSGNVLLWTIQRASRPNFMKQLDDLVNMVFLHCTLPTNGALLWDIVNEEAKEVAQYIGIIDHMVVVACILYKWKLRGIGKIDCGTHASNYWVCDGIIQGARMEAWAWNVGDALQRYIHSDWSWRSMLQALSSLTTDLQMHHYLPRPPVICHPSKITSVSTKVTSLFLSNYEDEESTRDTTIPLPVSLSEYLHEESRSRRVSTRDTTIIPLPASLFEHLSSSLHVLHLSRCTFRFAYPPFLYCNNLRFLLLHCCENDDTIITPVKDDGRAWMYIMANLMYIIITLPPSL